MELAMLFVLASGEATEKIPFYAFGIALAAWAVLLSVVGLTRPSFPGNAAAERGVIGISVLLVAGTLGTAILTASG
jgi:hypothetical protein